MAKDNYEYTMSVIIPSYNNGIYIRDAIESILDQYVDFSLQIIISDDASTDNSKQIIEEYKTKYPQIIKALYSEKNRGLFENYYKAVAHLNSKYFCVLDPDDYYTDRRRLQKAVDFFERNEDYTIYAMNSIAYNVKIEKKYKINYPDMAEGETHITTFEDYLQGRATLCNTPGSTYRNVAYSKETVEKIKSISQTITNKAAFRADSGRNVLHLAKGKAMFVNDTVAIYRIHDHNVAQNKKTYEALIQLAQSYILYDEFFDGIYKKKIYEIVFKYYKKAIVSYSYELSSLNGIISSKSEAYEMIKFVNAWLKENEQLYVPDNSSFYNIKKLFGEKDKRRIIWGTGISAKRLISKYNLDIGENDVFVDGTYTSGQSGIFYGKKVYSPQNLVMEKDDFVVICSSYYNEIIEGLNKDDDCKEVQIINLYAFDEYYGGIE